MMLVKTLRVRLNLEDTLKVSIFRTTKQNKEVYFARYVKIELDIYKDLSPKEQNITYGIIYTEFTNGPTVYYADLDKFIKDLESALIGDSRLKSKL